MSFGRHDPPKAKPGLQVDGRDIELLVAAEDLHDFVAVEAEALAELPISLANVIFSA